MKMIFSLFLTFLALVSCHSQEQGLGDYYNQCIEQKEQGRDFVTRCDALEALFIELNLLDNNSSEAYVQLVENIGSDRLGQNLDEIKQELNGYQKKYNVELDAIYYHFLECMYFAIVERSTSLKATNYVHFQTLRELEVEVFNYSYYKSLIDYAVKNDDFGKIEYRIPFLLGISYHLMFEK